MSSKMFNKRIKFVPICSLFLALMGQDLVILPATYLSFKWSI